MDTAVQLALIPIMARAIDVLGSEEIAKHWLNCKLPVFKGETPMDYIRRGDGLDVMNVLGRIEHGIHS